jgi:hypothetical protein
VGKRYEELLTLALQATDGLSGPARAEVRAEIAEHLAVHL